MDNKTVKYTECKSNDSTELFETETETESKAVAYNSCYNFTGLVSKP